MQLSYILIYFHHSCIIDLQKLIKTGYFGLFPTFSFILFFNYKTQTSHINFSYAH